jgi:uncharacterized Fe-S center protein
MELEREIALVADLMVVASESPGALDQGTIDKVLGVIPRQSTGPATAES